MWAEERHERILELLRRDLRVAADALATTMDVSRETIRRDLKALEQSGKLQRTHGGAMIAPAMTEEPFRNRVAARTGAKSAIAAAAMRLVEPGTCCFIDAGSTTTLFARALAGIANVSIITNSLEAALAVHAQQPGTDIILLGGALGKEVPATFGARVIEQVSMLRADFAFVSPVGIEAESGVSYYDLAEAETARMMLQRARRRVVLADAAKCGVVSRVVVCDCKEIDVLVSDVADAAPFREAGIREIIAA